MAFAGMATLSLIQSFLKYVLNANVFLVELHQFTCKQLYPINVSTGKLSTVNYANN